MRAFLDERTLTVSSDSIAEAIAAARAAATERGRVIVDVLVDGSRLDDEALESPSAGPAGDIELKCVSADPRQLVADSFADVAAALTNARPTQRAAAAALQTGKLETAFELLAQSLEVWDAVHRVAEQGPALLGVGLTELSGGGGGGGGGSVSIQAELNQLSGTLQEVKDAVANQDWSTLADLLGHDLDDSAERWSGHLTAFAERTRAGDNGAQERNGHSGGAGGRV